MNFYEPKDASPLQCSFSDRPESDVDAMIKGPDENICDSCVGEEFQLAKAEEIGAFGKGTFHRRLSYFFSDEERPHLWQVRNNVVAKLPHINEDNELYSLKELDMANEIRDFDMKGDFWFRYYDEEDVRAWMKVILPILDRSLHQIESLAKAGWLQ